MGLLGFIFYSFVYAQSKQAGMDSTFQAYMKKAGAEIRESGFADSLQKKYAEVFYNYYLKHPDSEAGNQALWATFTMWGNLGAGEQYDEATERFSYDSENWRIAIMAGHNVYYKDEEKSIEEFIGFVEELRNKLTHPVSKSQALLYLARHNNKEGNSQKTVELAREIIDINANEFYVEQALGFQHEAETLAIGVKAPGFEAATVEGQKISLSGLSGKVVILEFRATWCGPCKPEIPHLKSLQNRYSENELKIVGISLDYEKEKLEKYVEKEEMDWPQILQTKQYDDEISELYNVYVIPRSFIIGRDGIIIAKNLRGKDFENKVVEIMQE